MCDSSTAPEEWIKRIRDIWGDLCFFNSSAHALKRYPNNMKKGLYHKVVVTANPGLQKVYAGVDALLAYYPDRRDFIAEPKAREVIKIMFPELSGKSLPELQDILVDGRKGYGKDAVAAIAMCVLGYKTMKGSQDRPWHFYNPTLVEDINPAFRPYKDNVKFYRIRALPTIQPHVEKFAGHPVVYTVLRFKTVQQSLEFARKYNIETVVRTHSKQDRFVTQFYANLPGTKISFEEPKEDERSHIMMRDKRKVNGSPNRGQWSLLYNEKNFFRAGKEQMDDMDYVCDRASKSCKACGLCATLDGTEPDWQNPRLAALGIVPKKGRAQMQYVANADGMPVATAGVVGKWRGSKKRYDMTPVPKGLNWTQAEVDFFKRTKKETGRGFRTQKELDNYLKSLAKASVKRAEKAAAAARRKNPSDDYFGEVSDPMAVALSLLGYSGPRRNPPDEMGRAIQISLRMVMDYIVQDPNDPENYWVESWNTHEDVGEIIARSFWHLMREAKSAGLPKAEAIAFARQFSFTSCGMDLFDSTMNELEGIYDNTSYWNEDFGPV
jgi:hypothetical protein